MKSIARIVLAVAVLFSAAARASFGTIGAANTDAVTTSVSGFTYASARWIVTTAGTATVTTEYTSDGVNWKAPPFSRRVDAVAANPSILPWQNTTPIVGSYETPLPGDTLAFRVRCGTVGTSTVVSVNPGIVYVPGTPVIATLYDTSSGNGVAQTTSVFDFTGWNSAVVIYSSGGGTAGTVVLTPVGDDGVAISAGNTMIASTAAGYANLTRFTSQGGSAPTVLPRRASFNAPLVVAQVTRLVVYAAR